MARMTVPLPHRPQSRPEEAANSASHAVAFVLAALLMWQAARMEGAALQVAGRWVFALTMMLLYLASTLFHGLPAGRGKRFFEKLDHAAIYLFIAGSYTAFAAPALQGAQAWALFALVWSAAAAGVWLSLSPRSLHPLASTAVYVAMGWLVLLAALPWIGQVSPTGVRLLVAGGVAYTAGAVLFLLSARLRYAHFAWHLFVMAGSGLHVAATARAF